MSTYEEELATLTKDLPDIYLAVDVFREMKTWAHFLTYSELHSVPTMILNCTLPEGVTPEVGGSLKTLVFADGILPDDYAHRLKVRQYASDRGFVMVIECAKNAYFAVASVSVRGEHVLTPSRTIKIAELDDSPAFLNALNLYFAKVPNSSISEAIFRGVVVGIGALGKTAKSEVTAEFMKLLEKADSNRAPKLAQLIKFSVDKPQVLDSCTASTRAFWDYLIGVQLSSKTLDGLSSALAKKQVEGRRALTLLCSHPDMGFPVALKKNMISVTAKPIVGKKISDLDIKNDRVLSQTAFVTLSALHSISPDTLVITEEAYHSTKQKSTRVMMCGPPVDGTFLSATLFTRVAAFNGLLASATAATRESNVTEGLANKKRKVLVLSATRK